METNEFQNRFRINEDQLIGRGTFGSVYRGFDNATGAHVAVKKLSFPQPIASSSSSSPTSPASAKKSQQQHEQAKEQVLEECRMLARLAHPNIVRLVAYHVDDVRAEVSLVLDWMPSGSIHDVLEETVAASGSGSSTIGGLPEPVVRRYALDAAKGLAYLHSNGVVHRDVKPHNMLVSIDGSVSVSDFGTAKQIIESSHPGGTTNDLKGTPRYLAPENISKRKYTFASDIWSYGMTLLHMCSGELPWTLEQPPEAGNMISVIFFIGMLEEGAHVPALLSEENVEAWTHSLALRQLVLSCLKFDPEKRPTALQVMQHEWFTSVECGAADVKKELELYSAAVRAAKAEGAEERELQKGMATRVADTTGDEGSMMMLTTGEHSVDNGTWQTGYGSVESSTAGSVSSTLDYAQQHQQQQQRSLQTTATATATLQDRHQERLQRAEERLEMAQLRQMQRQQQQQQRQAQKQTTAEIKAAMGTSASVGRLDKALVGGNALATAHSARVAQPAGQNQQHAESLPARSAMDQQQLQQQVQLQLQQRLRQASSVPVGITAGQAQMAARHRQRKRNPLHDAAISANSQLIQGLLQSNPPDVVAAWVNEQDSEGRTLLHQPVMLSRSPNLVQALLELQCPTTASSSTAFAADLSIQESKHQWTAFHAAVFNKHTKMVELFLTIRPHDTPLNAQDSKGTTPLACAAFYKNREMVRLLLSVRGVDVDIPNDRGKTALEVTGDAEIMQAIIEYKLIQEQQ